MSYMYMSYRQTSANKYTSTRPRDTSERSLLFHIHFTNLLMRPSVGGILCCFLCITYTSPITVAEPSLRLSLHLTMWTYAYIHIFTHAYTYAYIYVYTCTRICLSPTNHPCVSTAYIYIYTYISLYMCQCSELCRYDLCTHILKQTHFFQYD